MRYYSSCHNPSSSLWCTLTRGSGFVPSYKDNLIRRLADDKKMLSCKPHFVLPWQGDKEESVLGKEHPDTADQQGQNFAFTRKEQSRATEEKQFEQWLRNCYTSTGWDFFLGIDHSSPAHTIFCIRQHSRMQSPEVEF